MTRMIIVITLKLLIMKIVIFRSEKANLVCAWNLAFLNVLCVRARLRSSMRSKCSNEFTFEWNVKLGTVGNYQATMWKKRLLLIMEIWKLVMLGTAVAMMINTKSIPYAPHFHNYDWVKIFKLKNANVYIAAFWSFQYPVVWVLVYLRTCTCCKWKKLIFLPQIKCIIVFGCQFRVAEDKFKTENNNNTHDNNNNGNRI